MYCSNCGRKMEGNVCSYCGFQNEKEEENTKATRKSKKLYIFSGIAVVMFVVIILCITIFGKSKSETFMEYLKEGNFKEADSFYRMNLMENEEELKKTYELVVADIDTLVEKYYGEQISYDNAKSALNVYSSFYATEVNDALEKIRILRNSRDIFDLAEQKYSEENYEEAYDDYAAVIEEDSNFSIAQEKMQECYLFIKKQLFAVTEETAANGNYLEAVEKLEKKLDFLSEEDKAVAQEKIHEYEQKYIAEMLKNVDTYLATNDYGECYTLLQRLNISWDDVAEIKEARNKVNSSYEEFTAEMVNTLIQERDFISCMEIINKALIYIPKSEKLLLLKEDVLDYFPIKLQDIFLFDNNLPGSKEEVVNPKDMYQNEYEEGILYYDTYYEDYADHYNCKEKSEIYLLNREYMHFTATIAPSEKWKKKGLGKEYGTAQFTIYGDGVRLFSASIWRDTKPINIDVDVTGIEKMEIAFYGGSQGYFLLAEPFVYKKY